LIGPFILGPRLVEMGMDLREVCRYYEGLGRQSWGPFQLNLSSVYVDY